MIEVNGLSIMLLIWLGFCVGFFVCYLVMSVHQRLWNQRFMHEIDQTIDILKGNERQLR